MAATLERPGSPLLVAHRGARVEAPDNTKAAFERALATPIDGIEIDVQMSRDGVLMLYHDRTLHRICGRRKRVSDQNWASIFDLDAGAWFDPRFKGEPFVTFDAFLAEYTHRTRLLVEIKSRAKERKNGHVKRLAEKAVATLTQPIYARQAHHFSILSFDSEVLKIAAKMAPQLELVLNLPDKAILLKNALARLQKERFERHHISGLCVKLSLLSPEVAETIVGMGKRLLTYSCNTPRQLKKASALPLNVLMTDDPRWLTSVLAQKGDSL